MEGYSLRDLERIFGVDHRTIVRDWIEPGLLVGRRWSGRGPHSGWLFEPATVDSFFRSHRLSLGLRRDVALYPADATRPLRDAHPTHAQVDHSRTTMQALR
jgi:hypothetical protein